MRNLKRFLAVLIVVAMMAMSMVPVFAASQTLPESSQILNTLGVLKGDGNGVTAEYLAKDTTRLQAVIMYLRLLGLEEEALNFNAQGKPNFDDANKVTWQGGKNILAYLKANPELGWQGYNNKFDPYGKATAQMLYKIMLVALGYEYDVDFTWDETLDFAAEAGLGAYADIESVTNEDFANIVLETLLTPVKGGEVTLVEAMAAADEDFAAKAVEAGLLVVEEPLAATVKAVGAKKLAVEFNQPVDKDAVTFELKQDIVSLAIDEVSFNDDATVATLTAANEFVAGTYTVVVNGLELEDNTFDVTVADETLTTIELSGTQLPISTEAAFGFKALNQYGEDMEMAANDPSLTWVLSDARATMVNDASAKVNINSLAKDDKLTVTVIANNGVKASNTFTVVEAVAIKSITLGTITNDDSNAVRLSATDTAKVAFVAKDQYGSDVTAASLFWKDANSNSTYDLGEEVVRLVKSSANINAEWIGLDADGNAVALEDGLTAAIKLTVGNISTDETVVLTAVTPSGATSSITFKIYAVGKVDNAVLSAPSSVIADGDSNVYLPLTVTDQFGVAMTGKQVADAYTANNNVIKAFVASTSVSINNITIETAKGDNQGKLKLPLVDGSGKVTITVVTSTGKTSSVTLDVKPARYVQKVAFDGDVIAKYLQGASSTVKFKLYDQYGAEFGTDDDSVITTFEVVKISGDDSGLTVSAANQADETDLVANGITVNANAGKTGEYKLIVKVVRTDNRTLSTIYKNIKVIDGKSETITYKVSEIPTLYKNGAVNKYNATISVEATDASGAKVAIPDIITDVYSSDETKVVIDGTTTVYGIGGAEGSAIVTVVLNTPVGTQVVNREVKVSGEELVASSIKLVNDGSDAGSITLDTANATIDFLDGTGYDVKVIDQFGGDDLTTAANVKFYLNSNLGGKVTLTGSTVTVAGAVNGDEFTVTAVTKNGKAVAIKVNVSLD